MSAGGQAPAATAESTSNPQCMAVEYGVPPPLQISISQRDARRAGDAPSASASESAKQRPGASTGFNASQCVIHISIHHPGSEAVRHDGVRDCPTDMPPGNSMDALAHEGLDISRIEPSIWHIAISQAPMYNLSCNGIEPLPSLTEVKAASPAADPEKTSAESSQAVPSRQSTLLNQATKPHVDHNASLNANLETNAAQNSNAAQMAALDKDRAGISSAEGWSNMDKKLRSFDEDQIKDHKEDIDTLLVFAGLFSAVLTAFNVVSYPMLQQDALGTSVCLLTRMSEQLSSFSITGGFVNSTSPYESSVCAAPFQASRSVVKVNVLWFMSLVFSLITASFGMLVKQWLRDYMALEAISPQRRCRLRYRRYRALKKWRVFQIAAVLPLLLQIALALFLVGLFEFLHAFDPVVGQVVQGLVTLWLTLLALTTLMPIFPVDCPYNTPFVKGIIQQLIPRVSEFYNWSISHLPLGGWQMRSLLHKSFKMDVRDDPENDLQILLDADEIFMNDETLETVLTPCLGQMAVSQTFSSSEGDNGFIELVRTIVQRRVDAPWINHFYWTAGLKHCSTVIAKVLLDVLAFEVGLWFAHDANSGPVWKSWMDETLDLLLNMASRAEAKKDPVLLPLLSNGCATFLSDALASGNTETTCGILRNYHFAYYIGIDRARSASRLGIQLSSLKAIRNIDAGVRKLLSTPEWLHSPYVDKPHLAVLTLAALKFAWCCKPEDDLRNACLSIIEQLLPVLATAWEDTHRRVEVELSNPWPLIDTAKLCLAACDELQQKFPQFCVDPDLLAILRRMVELEDWEDPGISLSAMFGNSVPTERRVGLIGLEEGDAHSTTPAIPAYECSPD